MHSTSLRRRPTSLVALRRFALFILVSLTPTLAAREPAGAEVATPTFGTGSQEDLQVAVIEVKSVMEYRNLLIVEVTNRGKIAAEPLLFRIDLAVKSPPKQKGVAPHASSERFARADLPHFQRYGRPTPAGGKQRYTLSTGLIGKKSEYSVVVENANFVANGLVEKPQFTITGLKQIQAPNFQGTLPVSEVSIENPLPHVVDALFLVTLTQPRNTVYLLGVTLPAKSTYRWQINSLPGNAVFPKAGETPGTAIQVTKLELVDWTLLLPTEETAGRAIFEQAYRGWLRWPDPQPAVSGDFSFRSRMLRLNSESEYDSFEVKGRFTLDEKNLVTIKILSGGGANASMILETAFKQLRRESFEQVLNENEIIPIDGDRVEVRGPGFGADRSDGRQVKSEGTQQAGESDYYRVRGDRIIGSGASADLTTDGDFELRFETTPFGSGYVITSAKNRSRQWTCAYSEVDGLVMPVHATALTQFGAAPFSVEEISFSNLTTSGADRVQKKPPTGEGVAALRTIWNASFRLTAEPIVVRAKFEVTTPGTDWLWHGLKKLKGRVTLRGVGRSMKEISVEFDGIDSREKEMSLAGAFVDRLLMWYSCDPNDRQDFDTMFADCTIDAMTAEGSFAIEGRDIAKILTENGQYRGYVNKGGGKVVFSYQKMDERVVCTKVEADVDMGPKAWKETLSFIFAPVGETLLPSSLKFERVFGKDWGPETIVFKGVVIDPVK